MTKTSTIAAIIIGLIVVGGIAYALSSGDSAMMKEDNAAMMKGTDSVQGDAITGAADTKGDAMVQEGAMVKDGTMMEGDAMMKDETKDVDTIMKKGSYEAYSADKLARAETGDVVLFFRASWCPTCKALDSDIRAHLSAIPKGVTILDVNYDNSADLKKKYGVTYQHTFVQVRADGSMVTKWSGSPTLSALLKEVQ